MVLSETFAVGGFLYFSKNQFKIFVKSLPLYQVKIYQQI